LDKQGLGGVRNVVNQQPILETSRLLLRPLALEDAPAVQWLAGRREIADTTLSIPHPYSEPQAGQWILATWELFAKGKGMVFALQLKPTGQLIGTLGLRNIDREHLLAEMGFWVGVEYWGQGYAAEAGRAVRDFGFTQLGLNRIYATHMVRNPASGRVLAKIGMRTEGVLRQRVRKWGIFEDLVMMAVLRDEWEALPKH
jgi:ribosomal-protein-alanine N-acetyltransferase